MSAFTATLRFAFRNLRRNRARHAATFTAMALGTMGLSALLAYIVRWEHTLRAISVYHDFRGTVAVFKEGGVKNHIARPSRYSLTEDERHAIEVTARGFAKVADVGAVVRGQGLASNGKRSFPFLGTGIDPALQKKFAARADVRKWAADFTQLRSGTQLWETTSENPVGVAVGLARLLSNAGEGVQLLTQGFGGGFSAIDADVVHSYSTGVALTEDSRVRMSLGAAERLFDTKGASWVAVFLEDSSRGQSIPFARELERRLRTQGLKVEVLAWQDERVSPFYVGVMEFLYMMGFSFFLLISGVVALAVVNSVLLTSFERAKETGTLRAVGYMPARLAAGFTFELMLLGTMATLAGNALCFLGSMGVNALNLRFRPPGFADTVQFMLTPNLITCAAVAAAVISVAALSAFLMALRLAKTPIVSLLGEERN